MRPIHMTLDNESQHILVAFNNPSSLRVYRINKDFTPWVKRCHKARWTLASTRTRCA